MYADGHDLYLVLMLMSWPIFGVDVRYIYTKFSDECVPVFLSYEPFFNPLHVKNKQLLNI